MLYVHTYGFSRPEKKHAKNIIVGLMEHFAVSVVEVEMNSELNDSVPATIGEHLGQVQWFNKKKGFGFIKNARLALLEFFTE